MNEGYYRPPFDIWHKVAKLVYLTNLVLDNEMIKPDQLAEAKEHLADPHIKTWLEGALANKPYDTNGDSHRRKVDWPTQNWKNN